MRISLVLRLLYLAIGALSPVWAQTSMPSPAPEAPPEVQNAKAEELFALANQVREKAGVQLLKWDPALAAAALQHCLRMAQEGPIEHQYQGEQDLTARAGLAGAHFSLIEENIAVGSRPATIHQGWLNSQDHLANLLNPEVDSAGVAVVANKGVIFAVVDFARAVPALTQAQVEATFAAMLREKGLMVSPDSVEARAYCASSGSYRGSDAPSFLMRWQNPDVSALPPSLAERVNTVRYRKAQVGSCPPQDVNGPFTTYRVAVLLF